MPRVAAIDCGTNSIRLLVADVHPATGELVDLERTMEVVRLGQGSTGPDSSRLRHWSGRSPHAGSTRR